MLFATATWMLLLLTSFVDGAIVDRDALKVAVDNCLAANATGNCDCSSDSVDCGTAGSLPISQWDTSRVNDMNRLFSNQGSFNANISAWDVSGVTDMTRMFEGANSFAQDISSWNVVNVTSMDTMFYRADAFNAPIGSWNTDGVTNMFQMFHSAHLFDQPIGSWNTERVTTMQCMFMYAREFNQDISSWNTANVVNMWDMFYSADAFNQNIGSWNTEEVTDMRYMFYSADAFNQNIGSWNTEKVTDLSGMFQGAAAFNQDIGSWNTEEVTDMSGMFQGAAAFNQDIGSWTTTSVKNMESMFEDATAFNQNISSWNVSAVTDFDRMFYTATAFNKGIITTKTTWTGATGASATDMFSAATAWLQRYEYTTNPSGSVVNGPASAWSVKKCSSNQYVLSNTCKACASGKFRSAGDDPDGSNTACTYASPFASNTQLKDTIESSYCLGGSDATGANCTDGKGMYIAQWDTSLITDMNHLFYNKISFDANISTWNTAKVTKMDSMFSQARAFNQRINEWNTSSVVTMEAMFRYAESFDQPIGEWNTGRVTNMKDMFSQASEFNQNIGNWDTSSVTTMDTMFRYTESFNQPISEWNTGRVTNMKDMFSHAYAFNHSIGDWNTGAVENMELMFQNTGVFNQDISSWNTAAVTQMDSMFYGASAFNYDITGWSSASLTSSTDMFLSATAWLARYKNTASPGSKNGPSSNWLGPGPFTTKSALETATWNCLAGSADADGNCDCTTVDCGAAVYESISNWNTSLITDMTGLFEGKSSFNANIGGWNTGSVTNMHQMFNGATAFNQDIGSWDVSDVADMYQMFGSASSFNQNIGSWNTGSVTDMSGTFMNASAFNQPVGDWNTGSVVDMSGMFESVSAFNQPIGEWNTGRVTNMKEMFSQASEFNQNIGNWDTSSVTTMDTMFRYTESFNQPISEWNTGRVTNMKDMFSHAYAFNHSIGDWNTGAVENMELMFQNTGVFNQDISSWNTAAVTQMDSMFYGASAFNYDITGWSSASLTSSTDMFLSATAWLARYKNTASPGSKNGPSSNWLGPGPFTTKSALETATWNCLAGSADADGNCDCTTVDCGAAVYESISNWNTSLITDMTGLFEGKSSFNANIGGWNTGSVTNMHQMFNGATAFNQDIGSWDVSDVADMYQMFGSASSFNQNIGSWNTGSVTDMSGMFMNASAFNQPVGDWNTGSVVDMSGMFESVSAFNQPIGEWATGSVADMNGMFRSASAFNEPVGNWNTSSVTDMSGMFESASAFNQPIGEWNTGRVTNMKEMFSQASEFNQNIGNWDTSSVTTMDTMFRYTESFNQPISEWNTGRVTNMKDMFSHAYAFNHSIGDWNTGAVENMELMFQNTGVFNQDISSWNTAAVTQMDSMFYGASAFNYDITGWSSASLTSSTDMFLSATAWLARYKNTASPGSKNGPSSNWLGPGPFTTKSALETATWNCLAGSADADGNCDCTTVDCGAAVYESISNWNTSLITDMTGLFEGKSSFNANIGGWNTGSVTNMHQMFNGATAFNQDIGSWDVSDVADMYQMFGSASSFNQNIGSWNTGSVTDMSGMFMNASAFNQPVGDWNTGSVVDMSGMFESVSAFNQPIGEWNTGSVADMNGMFRSASAFNEPVGAWNTGSVTDMSGMFESVSAFNQPIGEWNTGSVADMNGMFRSASAFNQPIGEWATGSVADMSGMFESASAFNQPIGEWDTDSVTDMSSMFESASEFNYNITDWSSASLTTDMFLDATAWLGRFARKDGEDTTDGPPSKWGEPCGNEWYDATFEEKCEPRVNGIEVKGCNSTCGIKDNWRCDNFDLLRPPGDDLDSYNCTCDNPAGTYASPDLDCARTDCIYGERCLANGLGCAPGAGGNACDRCLTAADIAELPLNERSLSKNGYYKTGQMCTACPETSAGQLFAAAAVVVVLAFCGFKASQLMGAQATNNLKKIVESLQFFSLSLSMSIKWPGPVLNLGKYLEAFTFSIEFLRPECVATGLNWLNIFLSSVFFVPALIFIIIVVNNRRAKHRYKTTVRAIDSERHEDGETVYWIKKPGFLWGTRRAYESKGGDKIVRELQRQYRFRAALRSFGVLSLTVLYLPIVRMCLQSYDCIKIDGVDGLRLEHDIDILCESEGHVIIQAAAAVMLAIVGIGMPIYVIMQVRKIRLSGKLDDPQTIDSYGPFYDVYRREELTHDHKLEIARIRQTAVESSSFRRGEGTSDERPFDAATDDIAEEIANEARVDTEEDSSDVDRVDVEDDSDTPPPQKVASGLGKLARALTMTKSALGRTTSAKARERAHRMHWKDRFALHYLAVELVQKSCVILTTSPLVAETAVSGWALVVVHWFTGAFVYVCQPWRIMTLGFGKYKVRNCLNKVESLAGFLQGVGPFLAMIFPVQRNELGEVKQTVTLSAITVLLTIIITGLLSIRIIVFVGERVAVKRKKMDIDKDPEKCMQNVHKQLVKLATNRAIVSMFAFKADFDIKRRKARARLEDTRQAMLSRIDMLKSQQTDEDHSDKITALYEVANEMAHIVNTIVPQAPPTGPNAEGSIELLDEQLASILKDVDVRARANALDAPNSAAVHIVMKVHAFDTIICRLDEHLLEFAAAELVSELAELGRRHAELRHTRSCVAIGFGDAELRATFDALRSSIETLRHAVENDDFEAVFTTLNGGKEIIDSHLRWCRDQCELFKSAEDEHPDFLEDEPPLTTKFFKATVKVIQSHEKQLSKFKSECIRNWPPLFKNFGRVKYIQGFAEQLQNQLHLDLNESTPEEAKAVFDQVLAFTDGFAVWCGDLVAQVEGSDVFILFEPIARAMMESLKAIRTDAESQSALARQALSTIDYAVTQRALAATTRSGLQTALADGTSALEDQLAAEIAHMDAAKISRETTFETDKMRIEEALTTSEQESDGRRAVLEDDIRSQQDTIARLQNLKREEAAASSSINPLKWERFSRSTELAEAVSALRMSKQNLKNEELANEKARGDARKAVHSLERGLKKDLVECDVRAKKIRDDVAKELKKQTLDAQRKTPEDAKAHKASLASRRAVFQQQRAAAKLIASESREATRIQAQLAYYMRNLKARES